MNYWVATFIFLAAVNAVCAQRLLVEPMVGEENYYYQHTLSVNIGGSRFNFFHSSSLHMFYEGDELNELMSQSYLTYSLTGFAKLAVGTFYATKPGISPAASLQLGYSKRYFKAAWVPRVDLQKNGSIEMMMLLEYVPPINEGVHFYSRAQLMTNYGPYHHNRSYQNFRAGLQLKQTVLGIALNVDERGSDMTTLHNWGLFLRYEFN